MFTTLLVAGIFQNIGQYALSLDINHNKRGITNWMGLAFYGSIDWFALGMMS